MPYKSKAQQRYLESKASPLSEGQKQEFRSATNFGSLKEKVAHKAAMKVAEANKKKK